MHTYPNSTNLFFNPSNFCPIILLFLSSLSLAENSTYQIRPNDQLQIVVIGAPDFNQTVTVMPDGKVSYFGGDILVTGQNKVDLLIRDHLVELGLLKDPVVMVAPIPKKNEIYVGGNVKNPGRYNIGLEDKIDLYRAVALGGGTLINSDLESVRLVHRYHLSHHNLIENDGQQVFIDQGDLVYVPVLQKAEVQGEVKNPGPIFFRKQIRIDHALAKAGGPNHEQADLTTFVIIRCDGEIETVIASENFWQKLAIPSSKRNPAYLLPNDVLYVPNAFKTEPIYVLGHVNQPGPQLVRSAFGDGQARISVRQAISLAGGGDQHANRRKILVHRKEGETEAYDLRIQSSGEMWLYPGDTVEIPAKFKVNWSQVLSFISVTALITNMINK